MTRRRRVVVLALGGTIAMRPAEAGLVPEAGVAALLADLRPSWPGIDVAGEDLDRVPSAHLGWAHLADLATQVESLARAPEGVRPDGVVVTQGTDLLEDMAFGLDLLLDGDLPVVMTGSMRGQDVPSSDADANLVAAVRVAADPCATGRGVLVAVNEAVHAARSVRKAHTHRVDAFLSPGWGPEASVVEGAAVWRGRAREPRVRVPAAVGPWPRVLVLPTGLGEEGALFDVVDNARPDGLVVEGVGAGHVSRSLVDGLERIAHRVPTVLCTRVSVGPVLRTTYGYVGAETDLLNRGLLWGGGLPANKARVFLALAIAGGLGPHALRHRLEQLAASV